MAADVTASHLIFFIAGTLIAVAASGVFTGVVFDLVGKAQTKGALLSGTITTDISIINDPAKVVVSPNSIFYVKNTGQTTLDQTRMTTILDGQVVTCTAALAVGATFNSGSVASLTCASLAAGDHRVKVITDNGVSSEMSFRV